TGRDDLLARQRSLELPGADAQQRTGDAQVEVEVLERDTPFAEVRLELVRELLHQHDALQGQARSLDREGIFVRAVFGRKMRVPRLKPSLEGQLVDALFDVKSLVIANFR